MEESGISALAYASSTQSRVRWGLFGHFSVGLAKSSEVLTAQSMTSGWMKLELVTLIQVEILSLSPVA